MPIKDRTGRIQPDSEPVSIEDRHWPFLDGIRGVGILFIIGTHAQFPGFQRGFISIDLFFAVSGFLITTLLLREYEGRGTISIARFYMRRALRLLPALIALLGFLWFYAPSVFVPWLGAEVRRGALYAFFYMYNWAWVMGKVGINVLSHAWSLSIEEQFYFIWPAFLLALLPLRNGRRWALIVTCAVIVASTLYRVSIDAPEYLVRRIVGTDTRMAGILIGALTGMLLWWRMVPLTGRAASAIRLGALGSLAYLLWAAIRIDVVEYTIWGLLPVSVASALLILGFFGSRPPRLLRKCLEFPPLLWIGRRSYGLYLWHLPIIALPLPIFGDPVAAPQFPADLPNALGRIALSFGVAAASYAWIEKPFLRMKGRWSFSLEERVITRAAVVPETSR